MHWWYSFILFRNPKRKKRKSKDYRLLFFLWVCCWHIVMFLEQIFTQINLDRVLFKILFEIITVSLFVMRCIWDKKKVIKNIKRWIEKCVYDTIKILHLVFYFTLFTPYLHPLIYLHHQYICQLPFYFIYIISKKVLEYFFTKIISNNLQSKHTRFHFHCEYYFEHFKFGPSFPLRVEELLNVDTK